MEDVQPVAAGEDKPAEAIDGTGELFIAAEEQKVCEMEMETVADDILPAATVPKTIVEVVIDKKPEALVEEPIFPDHYYDDGNVPVFKPVRFPFR